MARKTISIEEKIDRQKQLVSKCKSRYETELKELDRLMQIRDEALDKELLAAFRKSGLSHKDVINFMTQHHQQNDESDFES